MLASKGMSAGFASAIPRGEHGSDIPIGHSIHSGLSFQPVRQCLGFCKALQVVVSICGDEHVLTLVT